MSKVLAVVNGTEITEDDLNYFLERLGPNGRRYASGPNREQVIYELINQEVIYLDAIATGMDQEEEFLQELEDTKRELLKTYAVRKIVDDVKVSESDMERYYEANKHNFVEDESIKARHILVETEEDAKKAIEEIKGGKDFEDVAKEVSSCPSKENGGDLGFFTKGRMVKEFEDAAFSLELNEISEPIQSQFGYHVIEVTDKTLKRTKPYEEIKDEIENFLTASKRNDEYVKRTSVLRAKYDIKVNPS